MVGWNPHPWIPDTTCSGMTLEFSSKHGGARLLGLKGKFMSARSCKETTVGRRIHTARKPCNDLFTIVILLPISCKALRISWSTCELVRDASAVTVPLIQIRCAMLVRIIGFITVCKLEQDFFVNPLEVFVAHQETSDSIKDDKLANVVPTQQSQ